MSELWTISVDGRIYGPYSLEQMRTFAGEGRLAPTSLVARPDQQNFRDASEVPELAALFRSNRPQALAEVMEEPAPSFGREAPAEHAGEMAHIVIMADMKSRSLTGLEEEIFNLGPAYTILPQAWLVKTSLPVSLIRNQLIQKLGKLDQLFIVDATNDRALWFNFGPEADTKLRRLWAKNEVLKRAG
ncbi:MAG TPA: DUF4339 domain-containing protein [Rhizomicrobium sp.]|jgi:hypothetical protein|nr:DUF4339 domain-containing protein [Rhizomicrobium sp.]